MNEWKIPPQFEKEIRESFDVPAVRPEFTDRLYSGLMKRADEKARKPQPIRGLRPAWVVTFAILAVIIIITLAIGPAQVSAAIRQLFGYLPGTGIVDQSVPIRVLAEPVSVTRDEITITVSSATLSGDKTQIEYRVFGVPASAYPDREDIIGCITQGYLRLEDGRELTAVDFGYQAVPAEVNEAIFVIPCIVNTMPGRAPENWELPLRFVPAPPELTLAPVSEVLPSPQVESTLKTVDKETEIPATEEPVRVSKVIETEDGYILIGSFQPQTKPGESIQQIGDLKIRDANGKEVPFTYPLDVNEAISQEPDGSGWAAEFKAYGLVYPLTISFSGVGIYPADPNSTAEFSFDAGPNPQVGQVWEFNHEIQLAGQTVKLISISTGSRGTYSFAFEADPKVYSFGVEIPEFTPNGGGGGGGGRAGSVGLSQVPFSVSISYEELPSGLLTVRLSNLTMIGDSITWEGEWSPTTIRTDLQDEPTKQSGLCLTAESLTDLQPAPVELVNGKVLVSGELFSGVWGLSVYNLDENRKDVEVPDGNWGALSADGKQLAYAAPDNQIHILDLDLQTERILPGISGSDLKWSPDGKQIAYVGMGEGFINSVFVINVDSYEVKQISTLSHQTIIGWSPEGLLYFATPYIGSAAWKVANYDFSSGTVQELFDLEDGTIKYLNPSLSPDGKWIAYRGTDNSSVYLVRPDGSDMHQILDNVNAIGLDWSQSGWLAVSMRKSDSEEASIALIDPDGCEAYLLPLVMKGDLEGVFIR
ncbi:MAG: PD40 domain-containing protein [Anaerolineaceae bacterium]|nr:PD40 domain-containing protein [Anaerolineaceae bacterium]